MSTSQGGLVLSLPSRLGPEKSCCSCQAYCYCFRSTELAFRRKIRLDVSVLSNSLPYIFPIVFFPFLLNEINKEKKNNSGKKPMQIFLKNVLFPELAQSKQHPIFWCGSEHSTPCACWENSSEGYLIN